MGNVGRNIEISAKIGAENEYVIITRMDYASRKKEIGVIMTFPECGKSGYRRAPVVQHRCDINGAGDGDRTRDIQLGKLAFYR